MLLQSCFEIILLENRSSQPFHEEMRIMHITTADSSRWELRAMPKSCKLLVWIIGITLSIHQVKCLSWGSWNILEEKYLSLNLILRGKWGRKKLSCHALSAQTEAVVDGPILNGQCMAGIHCSREDGHKWVQLQYRKKLSLKENGYRIAHVHHGCRKARDFCFWNMCFWRSKSGKNQLF